MDSLSDKYIAEKEKNIAAKKAAVVFEEENEKLHKEIEFYKEIYDNSESVRQSLAKQLYEIKGSSNG